MMPILRFAFLSSRRAPEQYLFYQRGAGFSRIAEFFLISDFSKKMGIKKYFK